MGFLDKFIPNEVKQVFKPVAKASKKFIPRELRPFLPMITPFLPATGIMGTLGGPMGFGKMYLANLLSQQAADPDAEFDDLNQFAALLSGTQGGLTGTDTAANLRGMKTPSEYISKTGGSMPGQGYGGFDMKIPEGRSFLTKAKDLGLEGLAEASDYLTNTTETLQDYGSGTKDLFTKEGAKEFARATAVPFSTGIGGVAEAYQRPLIREFEKDRAAEEAEIEATTTANDQERADLTMEFMRQAGHDETTIEDTLALDGLESYYSPPTESAAQGGIIGLKEGGSVNTPKRGLVNEPGGYAGVMPSIKDIWAAEGGDDPLGTIVKLGLTFRKPIVEIVNLIGVTGGVAADLISSVAKLGYDVTEPIRDVVGSVASTGLDGIKFALGQTDKWRYAQRPYQALRMAGLDDTEARLSLQEGRIGDFRKDPELIRALQSRLFEDKIGYGSDYQGGEVELYPGQSTKYAQGGIIGLKEGGMLDFGGREMDLRGGGFVPIGKKERADDVPARLSKNEFVMTADAVRAAGGGSVNKGAQRMYDVMNKLEARA